MCIAIAISLLMILICAMATYGAYKVSSFEIGAGPSPWTLILVTQAATCEREVMILSSYKSLWNFKSHINSVEN